MITVRYQEIDLGFGDSEPTFVCEVRTLEEAKAAAREDARDRLRLLDRYSVQMPLFPDRT